VHELTLAPAVGSVGTGRRFVRQALEEWGLHALVDTAVLLTSEVVTNSVLHARTAILLTVTRSAEDLVTISVRDGSRHPPQRRVHPPDSTTGRGVELLDALATGWSVRQEEDGKSVVFSVGGGIDPWLAHARDAPDARA
jgi:anti-sigma regulatory factor (Ser/Thr protein kinase)